MRETLIVILNGCEGSAVVVRREMLIVILDEWEESVFVVRGIRKMSSG